MSCDKVDASLLQEYLEGTIDPLEKIFVQNHLSICGECRRELSELKLLFWELDNNSNYEIEYPEELDSMSSDLIDSVLTTEKRNSTRAFVDIQVNALKISSKFIKYIPGAKQTPDIIKKASKKASTGITKGVKKLLEAK